MKQKNTALMLISMLAAFTLLALPARAGNENSASAEEPGQMPKPATKPATKPHAKVAAGQSSEAALQAHNAARPDNGARPTLVLEGNATKDKNTTTEMSFDGNPKTRCVVSGSPYTYHVDLVAKIPITEIHFMLDHSDQAAPSELEITLSDGTQLKKTLEMLRPTKENPMPRQTIKIGKDLSWFEVKVVSVVPGLRKDGTAVLFGGLGEIEAITTEDLSAHTMVPDFNPAMPAYLDAASPRNDYSKVKVTMPPKLGLSGFPRLFMSRQEIVKWREQMLQTDRGREAVAAAIGVAKGARSTPVVFPDPKVPAQLKDRWDPAAMAHDRLSMNAGRMAWAYQLTDEESFAEKTREILVGYAQRYPEDYVEHKGVNAHDMAKVMSFRLSEAMWLLPLIQAYDMVHDAACMTADDRKLIETGLIRPALLLINLKKEAAEEVRQRDKENANWRTEDPATAGKPVGNWMTFQNACFVEGGIVLGDQNWIDLGAANTRLMIARGIGDDGMWREGAIGYQYFARMGLLASMEPLARQGIDLYSASKMRFKNLFDAPYDYAYSDGTMPGINDSSRTSLGGDWRAVAYDYAWLRYQDSNYGVAVNAAPRHIGQSPAVYVPALLYEKLPELPIQGLKSTVFDGLGFGIMRGEDSGGPTYLLFKCGTGSGGAHGHPDMLNVILFADGDELCGEPAFYRYEDSRHWEWTKTTLGHFSLTVDERNQMLSPGHLIAFHDAGAVKVMRGQSSGAYPGVGLDRTVVQMPGYFVDIYRAWSLTSHTYDYPLCFRGALDALAGTDASTLKSMGTSSVGYTLFKTKPAALVKGNWSGVWRREAQAGKPAVRGAPAMPAADTTPPKDTTSSAEVAEAAEAAPAAAVVQGSPAVPAHPANEIKVTVLGDDETTSFVGIGPDESHKVVLRRKGVSAVFAAVIDPFKDSDAVKSVEAIPLEGPVPGYGLKIFRSDGGTDVILVRFDAQKDGAPAPASRASGITTDALVSVVRLDAKGKTLDAGMVGGTHLATGDKTLTLPSAGTAWTK